MEDSRAGGQIDRHLHVKQNAGGSTNALGWKEDKGLNLFVPYDACQGELMWRQCCLKVDSDINAVPAGPPRKLSLCARSSCGSDPRKENRSQEGRMGETDSQRRSRCC